MMLTRSEGVALQSCFFFKSEYLFHFMRVILRREYIQWRIHCIFVYYVSFFRFPFINIASWAPLLRTIFSNIFYPGVFTQLWMGSIYTAILHPLTRVITGSAQLTISAPPRHHNTHWSLLLGWIQDSEFCSGKNWIICQVMWCARMLNAHLFSIVSKFSGKRKTNCLSVTKLTHSDPIVSGSNHKP